MKIHTLYSITRFGKLASVQCGISQDGITWTQVTANAQIPPRIGFVCLVFNNKIWVIGGFDSYGRLLNDVWSSSDGIAWVQDTPRAQFKPRFEFSGVVFNNKMWVIGGKYENDPRNRLNDVWSSSDGINWTQATEHAAFSERFGQTSVAFNNKIWVIGGSNISMNTPIAVLDDIWFSTDGVTWTRQLLMPSLREGSHFLLWFLITKYGLLEEK